MSLWQRMRKWVHDRTEEVQAEQVEEVAAAEPEELAVFHEPEDSDDTRVEFEEGSDEQPAEPTELPEPEPEPPGEPPEPEDVAEPPFEWPDVGDDLEADGYGPNRPREIFGDDDYHEDTELPTIPPEQAQEYTQFRGTGATTVDRSMPGSITISSPEYHVKGPSQRMGSSGYSPPLGTPFVVKCTQSGGVSGGAAATCTYSYICTTLDNATLNSGAANSVIKARITNVEYTAGTAGAKGLAVVDSDGSFVLLEVYTEVVAGDPCP